MKLILEIEDGDPIGVKGAVSAILEVLSEPSNFGTNLCDCGLDYHSKDCINVVLKALKEAAEEL